MRIALLFIVLILSACNSVKKTMGIIQETPDEYTVMPQRKLEMPDTVHLPEPNEDMAFLALGPVTDDTKALLIGTRPAKAVPHDPKAEQALLAKLPTQPEPKIRVLVNKDNKKPTGTNLLFWQKQVKGKALDAEAESQRLQKESTANEIVSSGS